MIRINLLPEEYRKAERTSPKVFASLLTSVALVCCSLGWFGYVYVGELGRLEMKVKQDQESLTTLMPQVAYHDSLTRETNDFQARFETIEQISKSRALWTPARPAAISPSAASLSRRRSSAFLRLSSSRRPATS